jgi:dihydroorotase
MLKHRARGLNLAHLHPLGALTARLEGERLAELAELQDAGCVAFSQANAALPGTEVLWRALQYAATFGFGVWLQPQDPYLARNGVAHDGEVATRLGLPGIPPFAETISLATIHSLVRVTGTRVHLCRLSTADGVAMVRQAKRDGLPITADVAANHVHLSDIDIGWFDAHFHLVPPLRSLRDRDALRAGLADGTIDAVCSDHTPVDEDAKLLPFAESEPGAVGLELLLPLTLKWAAEAKVSLVDALARITSDPARVLRIGTGHLGVGQVADVCVFDPMAHVRVSPGWLKSQGKNTPFLGYELPGVVRCTLVAGHVVHETPAP